jgi:hypothetical protein
MRDPFPFFTIEGRPYPTVILGGDRFTGLFGPPRNPDLAEIITTPDYISTIFEACYLQGFRGYDISISAPVIDCFTQLKEKHPDCVGIANPNWECGLMLGNLPLREHQDNIIAYLFDRVFSARDIAKMATTVSEPQRDQWFSRSPYALSLTAHEIADIWLDEKQYQARLDRIRFMCDFCLVGTVFADWLPLLGRSDLLEEMIAMVRANGMVPLSIHHWTSLVLHLLEEFDVAGHWTYLNKACQVLTEGEVIEAIRHSGKPVTAFKALLSREDQDIEAYFEYLFHKVRVDAVDFGVETTEEARRIAGILHDRVFVCGLPVNKSA